MSESLAPALLNEGQVLSYLCIIGCSGRRLNSFFFALKVDIISALIGIICHELSTPGRH